MKDWHPIPILGASPWVVGCLFLDGSGLEILHRCGIGYPEKR